MKVTYLFVVFTSFYKETEIKKEKIPHISQTQLIFSRPRYELGQ